MRFPGFSITKILRKIRSMGSEDGTLLKTDRYNSLIMYYWQEASRAYRFTDADWRLVWCQIKAESNFNPKAESPVGARGLMQIMPKTWGDNDLDEIWNPESNIKRGVDHLGFLWNMFKEESGLERWKFALGAFNCGQGWVIKAQAVLKAKGRPTNQWKDIVEVLPGLIGPANAREVSGYVGKIIHDYQEMVSS